MVLVHDTVVALRRAIQDNNLPLTVHDDGTIECSQLRPTEGFLIIGNRLVPQWKRCRQRMLRLHQDGHITAICLFKPLLPLTTADCQKCN
jgi:hypothetical protein